MAPTTYTDVLARNVRAARSRLGLSQKDAVDRMRALGFTAWHRPTMGNVERGERALRADEVLGLAIALETSASRLMKPLWEDQWVELPNGMSTSVGAVVTVVTGTPPSEDSVATSIRWHNNTPYRLVLPPHEGEAIRNWITPESIPQLTTPTKETDLQPVVAAIVTSPLGVLVGRRNDGKPPWTFIAGEQEPGERIEDTAIREVKEETGLRVEAGERIGERVHPKTGRTMIYMAAAPTHGTDVFVGDEDELAEVRWVSLAEADELLPGMFGPVREHLARELSE